MRVKNNVPSYLTLTFTDRLKMYLPKDVIFAQREQLRLTMTSQIESIRSTYILHCTKRENLSANQVNGDHPKLGSNYEVHFQEQ